MSEYRDIVIETILNKGEASSKPIRARPVEGQGFSTDLRVECSKGMREHHPIGTKFLVQCKITDREGAPFLYRHYRWDYKVLTDEEARAFIEQHYRDD